MRIATAWVVAAAAGLALGAWAAAPGDRTAPMTLESCVREALRESPGLESSRLRADAARETSLVLRSAYLPSLGATVAYRRLQTRIFFPESLVSALTAATSGSPLADQVTPVLGPTDMWSLGLRASYTLFDSGRRKAAYEGSRAGEGAASADADASRQDTVLQVSRAYYLLLSARELVGVRLRALERSEDHLRLARARKEAGAVSRGDVLRFEVEASESRLLLVSAEGAARVARGALNTAMGRGAEEPLELAPPEAAPNGEVGAQEELAATALASRPELRVAAGALAAREHRVEGARGAFGPRLDLEASWGRLDDLWYPTYKDWSVGLTFSWPLFTGFARKHELARAKLELASEREAARNLELRIRQEVWEARSGLEESLQALATARVLREQAEESLRVARERYAEGAGTASDLLDAEASLAGAESRLAQAECSVALAEISLRRAVGAL